MASLSSSGVGDSILFKVASQRSLERLEHSDASLSVDSKYPDFWFSVDGVDLAASTRIEFLLSKEGLEWLVQATVLRIIPKKKRRLLIHFILFSSIPISQF